MYKILNEMNVDTTKEPIFLGKPLGLQRYDRFKYYGFYKLFSDHLSQFWRPQEIPISKDRSDYNSLSDGEKFIFTKNLQYQTMMDSVVARGADTFIRHVSLPEVEAYMKAWAFFETIHSESYTYIIRNTYSEPEIVLDEALNDEQIMSRAKTIVEEYEKLDRVTEGDVKGQLYLSLISVYILEAIRFYVSFVCSFAFAENKKMQGNSDIIQLIRRDEALHRMATMQIINLLHTEKSEGFLETADKYRDAAKEMFLVAAREEQEWADYLFSDGRKMMGLNAEILKRYVEWITDSRLADIGFDKVFNTKNPIGGWYDKYMNPSNVQVAPQEKEIISYRIGSTEDDLEDFDFEL